MSPMPRFFGFLVGFTTRKTSNPCLPMTTIPELELHLIFPIPATCPWDCTHYPATCTTLSHPSCLTFLISSRQGTPPQLPLGLRQQAIARTRRRVARLWNVQRGLTPLEGIYMEQLKTMWGCSSKHLVSLVLVTRRPRNMKDCRGWYG